MKHEKLLERLFANVVFKKQENLQVLRAEHHPQSYTCNESGDIIGLIVRECESLTQLTLTPELHQLQYLNLSDNSSFETLYFATSLPNLLHLDLSDNKLSTLHLLSGFEQLHTLDVSRNKLQKTTFEGNYPQLQLLDFSGNELTDFEVPADAPCLQYLYLSNSQIQQITFQSKMPNLEILHLSNNQLQHFHLPDGFKKLQHLRLDKNKLEQLEFADYRELKAMRYLFLKENQLQDIPPEIWEKEENAWQSVQGYLRAAASGLIINNEAKVIWFGNGEAGKTTLSHQLRHREFASFERTEGIEIKDWVIPYADLPKEMKDKIQESIAHAQKKAKDNQENIDIRFDPTRFEVHLKMWDFGGQEYYHATHRLFLNNNVLYLLVWDHQTDRQHEDLKDYHHTTYPRSYWRHNIEHYADRNKVVLEVQNKAEEVFDANNRELKYKVAFRENSKPLSIQEYEIDVTKLEDAILGQLQHLNNLGGTFPEVYDHLRQALRKLEQEGEQKILSFEEYRVFCRQNDTTKGRGDLLQDETQIENLTKFLDDTGAIICYRYGKRFSPKLQNYVFISPKWVTSHIYHILDEKHINRANNPNKGEFSLQHVQNVTQNTGLPPVKWIELMEQFQLIFEIQRKKQTRYIAPQYLPLKCANEE
ncbi:MAG: COR domain-containing protein, partial [Chitinophagales bacterium]